ncbi:hypothetical protein M413DRAFT_13645 [Hebeloma cylindrosporum]|uniref:Uncharacterized protein n=1 Tax=Hebeloma cylindrosporum TaxID=76867 RepID=A0A0C2XG22_HEBCY|nr:hypothetical protein M413DRAFT_13645 [Hebeloma cylindrosporum h7]
MTPRGIDIEHARKELGLHAIAFITDVEPFRMVFNPADENWLSPLAVYNLSKEHTQPIKVFEPQRPDVTDSSRAQLLFFALFSFTLDLVKLLLGFPEADGEHITFLYGRLFASIYKVIGEFTGALKFWEIFAACSLICLMICFDVRLFFHTMYLWFKSKGTEISFFKMSKLFDPVFLWFDHYQWVITGLCLFLAFNFTFMPSYVHVVLE